MYFPARRRAPYECTRLLSYFEETFARTTFAVASCAVPGLSEFYSPVLFTWQTSVWHSSCTPAGLENSWSTRHSRGAAAYFCSYDLRYSKAECILLPCCLDLVTSVCAVRGAHLRGSTACIEERYSFRLCLQLKTALWLSCVCFTPWF